MEPVSTYNLVRVRWPCYIYEDEDDGNKTKTGNVPKRLALLQKGAALALPGFCFASDFYRSAQQQITALNTRKGAQWVGYSGHGEGVSVDLDCGWSMKEAGLKTKKELDTEMLKAGWVNHILPVGQWGHESWHYNYLPDIAQLLLRNPKACGTRSLDELEAYIVQQHQTEWMLLSTFDVTKKYRGEDAKPLQYALQVAKFYDGDIDGIWGRYSISAFLHASAMWGRANHSTRRVLAFISARVNVIGEVSGVNERVFKPYAEAEGIL